jgi:hypothetical protein
MYRKNVAGQYLTFALVNASSGAALTGATVTAKRSIDGGAQASCTGTVSETALGQYSLALSQADTNGNNIGFLFTATSAIPVHIAMVTTAADPTDAAAFGLSRIDAAISSRSTYAGGAVASVTAAVTVGTNNDKTGYGLSSAAVQAIWDAATSALSTVGSIGKLIVTNLDALISTRLASSSYTAAPTATQNADALLTRDWTAVSGEAARSVLNALRALRNKVSRTASTVTVTTENDSTVAWSAAIVTDADADPVTEVDPS